MSYDFAVWEHRYVWWVNWIISAIDTLECVVTLCCHAGKMSLRESWSLERLMLWRKYAWLIYKWLLIKGIWIVVLTSRYVFRWNVIKDMKVLVFAWASTWSVCDGRVVISVAATCPALSKAWIHNAFIHVRHVEFWLLKFILDLFSSSANLIMDSRMVHSVSTTCLVMFGH